jgi:L-ascorbate metabolism protein UlaG (beta-lactamase superfamily)
MPAEVTAIGNEGFEVVAGGVRLFIDAFYRPAPWVGAPPARRGADVREAGLLLVTHAHPDHFNPDEVADVARRTGASVVGPAAAIRQLGSALPTARLLELEPAEAPAGHPADSREVTVRGCRIVAFRTFHARGHNSYLVEMPGLRFFHDGDNENTRRIDARALGTVDVLFLATWKGAGWVEFAEAVSPRRWFLMHLTEDEFDQQERGGYFPGLCDHIPLPDRLVTLRPGQSAVV